MNQYTSNAIISIGIISAVVIALYLTHNAWSLLGLIFLQNFINYRNKKEKDEETI